MWCLHERLHQGPLQWPLLPLLLQKAAVLELALPERLSADKAHPPLSAAILHATKHELSLLYSMFAAMRLSKHHQCVDFNARWLGREWGVGVSGIEGQQQHV